MKQAKVIIFFLLTTCLFTACSSDDDDFNPNAIQPIILTEGDIVDFFNSELFERHSDKDKHCRTNSFFDDHYHVSERGVAYIINSRQELADVYRGEKELPAIDFDKYTLIIGYSLMPYYDFYVAKKELVSDENGLQLTVYARNEGEILTIDSEQLYFWGLYPKQSQRMITLKVIEEYPNF